MELVQTSKEILGKIEALEGLKKDLPLLAQEKSRTMATYEKELAKEMLSLVSANYSVTLAEKVAKGKCADLSASADLAESMYKNCLKIIDITEAQLNGYQSINRHLSEN